VIENQRAASAASGRSCLRRHGPIRQGQVGLLAQKERRGLVPASIPAKPRPQSYLSVGAVPDSIRINAIRRATGWAARTVSERYRDAMAIPPDALGVAVLVLYCVSAASIRGHHCSQPGSARSTSVTMESASVYSTILARSHSALAASSRRSRSACRSARSATFASPETESRPRWDSRARSTGAGRHTRHATRG
jgi:hypothetical protein